MFDRNLVTDEILQMPTEEKRGWVELVRRLWNDRAAAEIAELIGFSPPEGETVH